MDGGCIYRTALSSTGWRCQWPMSFAGKLVSRTKTTARIPEVLGGTTRKADSRGVPGYASQRLPPIDNAAQLRNMTIFSNREGLRGSGDGPLFIVYSPCCSQVDRNR